MPSASTGSVYGIDTVPYHDYLRGRQSGGVMTQAVVVMMSEDEARAALALVGETVEAGLSALQRAAAMIAEIEVREGYKALGYQSMAACLAKELRISRPRAYQVLDEVHVRTLLSELAGEPVPATVRQTRALKAPERMADVRERVVAGVAPEAAVQQVSAAYEQALAEQRAQGAPPKPQRSGGGYQPPVEMVRRWNETLEGWAERMEDNELAQDFERQLERLHDLSGRMLREPARA